MATPRSMEVTRRHDRSLYMTIVQKIIKPFKKFLVSPKKQYPPGSPQCKVPRGVRRVCLVEERKAEEIYIYDMASKKKPAKLVNHKTDSQGSKETGHFAQKDRIYYFGGGGFQMPPSREHWRFCAGLATKLPNNVVSVISCPLAPAGKAPTTFPHLLRLIRTLLRDAKEAKERVVFVGDSSGGNLSLSLTLAALQEESDGEEPLDYPPAALVAISPVVDLTNSNFEMQKIETVDPVLTVPFTGEVAEMWRGDWDAADPRVSPINANISLLKEKGVKLFAVTAGYDVLMPDALVLLEKCTEAGVLGEWLHWEKQMHCFPLAFQYGMRESIEGFEWVVARLEKAFEVERSS